MISISRRESLYTGLVFAFCTLALLLPRRPVFEVLFPLAVVCSGMGALVYILRAVLRPAAASSTESSADTHHPQ